MSWVRMAAAAVLVTAVVTMGQAGEFVWLEGEAGQASVKVGTSGWGNEQFLSEGRWMHVSFDADKVEGEVKADAVVVRYPFAIKAVGGYEVWSRIGFESARSAFEYRI